MRADSGYNSGGESASSSVHDGESQANISVPTHPLKVRPLGNSYLAPESARSACGTFAALPEEVLLLVLEHVDAATLRSLGQSCKYLYAFCAHDDLWRQLFINSNRCLSGSFTWRGTWRSTHLNFPLDQDVTIDCSKVFSDVLHRPFQCVHTPLEAYAANIPRQNEIHRFRDLNSDDFTEHWSQTPFILTEGATSWPVYEHWDIDSLVDKHGQVHFRAEAVDWPLHLYVEYMRHNEDESPIYLFDRSFATKTNLENQDPAPYAVPECFGKDLFDTLGAHRPHHQWLIIGPARSGSTYHKDPNHTSAWNAVIRGSKYWILFPSHITPPGVYMSEDQSEVTSPLSIAEWLLTFHEEARRTSGCLEGICHAGDIMHVPAGYWHLVVNLDESIAITQNFVPEAHLQGVLGFLKDKPDQVSGFQKDVASPYNLFVDCMKTQLPEVIDSALSSMKRNGTTKKRKWEDTTGSTSEATPFAFGFGNDDDDDLDVP